MELPTRKKRLGISFQQEADPQVINSLSKTNDWLGLLFNAIKSIKLDIPRVFPVVGRVSVDKVDNLPPVHVSNLSGLTDQITHVSRQLVGLQAGLISALKEVKLTSPESVNIGNEVKVTGISTMLEDMEELKKGFNALLNKEFGSAPEVQKVELTNFRQMIPTPVTHISINGLKGFVKTTAVTVSSALTPLPGTALTNRRGLTVYNNGSVTVEIGGSELTFGQGMPVAAGTFSPALDASPGMVLYGRTSSSTADIRVMELSDEASGA